MLFVLAGESIPVFSGRMTCVFLKHPGEMTLGGKTQIVADGTQGFIRIAEEAFGFLRFFFENEVSQALAGFFDEFPGKVGAAEIQLPGDLFR